MVAHIPIWDTNEQEKQIIQLMLPRACRFLLTEPCKLSAKFASPAHIAKQERTAVSKTANNKKKRKYLVNNDLSPRGGSHSPLRDTAPVAGPPAASV